MKSKAVENKDRHEFALFTESLSVLMQGKKPHDFLVITDEKLVHRMMHVLRLEVEDTCVLFDRNIQVSAVIAEFTKKKQISVSVHSIQATHVFKPTITFLLPLLKRDDYESALYGLTEVGVNTIQLVFTQKTAHHWSGNRDSERAERIVISAAEQSKNFAYPDIKEPISLEAALQKYSQADMKIFFDPQGKKLFDIAHHLHESKPKDILLLVGPEGDLHLEEKKLIQDNDFLFCALTPTVMRAVQAAALGAGFIRSLV
jgi:16S rRNA (uracil1498-N3)-methyltransferase